MLCRLRRRNRRGAGSRAVRRSRGAVRPVRRRRPRPIGGGGEPTGIVPGSKLTVSVTTQINALIPYGAGTIGENCIIKNCYDTLFYAYHGDFTDIRPGLAKDYQVSEDGLVWTVQLRDDVYFTNGEQLTSADVVSSFNALKTDHASDFEMLSDWYANGDFEVVFELAYVVPDFNAQIAYYFWSILPASLLDDGGDIYSNDNAVGSGPYYIDSYTPGQEVVLKANENYWDPERMAHIETVTVKIITDADTAWFAFQNGELDVYTSLNYLQYMEVSAKPDEYNVITMQNTAVESLYFNTACAPFDDENVRLAMEHIINRDEVNMAATDGTGVVSNSPWFSGSGMYVSDEYLGTIYDYNVEKGLQILSDAGYQPSDISFEILAPTSSKQQMLEAENIQAQLLALGFDVSVATYERPTYMSYIRDMDYQCAIHDAGTAVVNLPFLLTNTFSSSGLNHFNNWSVSDPAFAEEVDQMILDARATADYGEQCEALRAVNKLMYEKAAFVPLIESVIWEVTDAGLAGMYFNKRDCAMEFWDAYWVE